MVLAGGRVDELLCLTERRPKAALPIFGSYRIIDFVLSNMMHSGVNNVGVLSQYRPYSLMRHIGTGEHWDFIGRKRGVRILPPYRGFKESDWYKGTADAVYQNVSYLQEYNPEYVLIAAGDHIYRMNYQPLLEFHIEKNADATVCFTKLRKKSPWFGYGVFDKSGRLIEYLEKPEKPPSDWVSMTVYIFKTRFLIDLLKDNAAENSHQFGRDIIPKLVAQGRAYAYKFTDYWAYGRTIESYYETNMDLLKSKIDLKRYQIRTNLVEGNVRGDRLPAYIDGLVSNAVISAGCVVYGQVKNSILSPGVYVAPKAKVIDSIIFHDTKIGQGVVLNRAIIDKGSQIGEGAIIGTFGAEIPSKEFGALLNCGITLLGRRTNIQDKTKIGSNTVIYADRTIDEKEIEPGSTLR